MSDLISRQAAIDAVNSLTYPSSLMDVKRKLIDLPSAQPERLNDDDFETIRIHLNAYKEKLCNQRRWDEAEEYQRIIDRFMAFASAQPDVSDTDGDVISRKLMYDLGATCIARRGDDGKLIALGRIDMLPMKHGKWDKGTDSHWHICEECGAEVDISMGTGVWIEGVELHELKYCPNCGCRMDEE